jgi:hypothetical protein
MYLFEGKGGIWITIKFLLILLIEQQKWAIRKCELCHQRNNKKPINALIAMGIINPKNV